MDPWNIEVRNFTEACHWRNAILIGIAGKPSEFIGGMPSESTLRVSLLGGMPSESALLEAFIGENAIRIGSTVEVKEN
jgi:hypothetical protein